MKDGNWIPIDKRIANLLPKGGEYTFLEAYISYRCDIESGAEISINGYSRIWSWSRNKVRNFIEGLRTGKGHVVDNQRTGKGQEIRLVFNNLEEQKDRQGTGKGQARDRQGTTTINPNNNKEDIYIELSFGTFTKSEFFDLLWREYPRRIKEKDARRHYNASVKTVEDMDRINTALQNYLNDIEKNKTDKKYIQHGSTWFNNWKDWEDK